MEKRWYILVIPVLIIIVLHYAFINGLEKLLIYHSTHNRFDIYRPNQECIENVDSIFASCLGMPSGHSEIITIIVTFLLYKKYISIHVALLLIAIVGSQRVVFNYHTPLQVFIGVIIGFLYSFVYYKSNYSWKSLLISLGIGIVYSIFIINIFERKLQVQYPEWVNKNMYDKMKEKMNSPFYLKFISILYICCSQHRPIFISWCTLENYLNTIVEKIKKENTNYDAVIGIKTGGAIISDYISKELNLKNYKIKLSSKENKCNKQYSDSIKTWTSNYIMKNKDDYYVCEGILDNIEGKNVIIIDESVASGKTIKSAIDYMKFKNVNNISVHTIFSNECFTYKNTPVRSLFKSNVPMIWPWGYDN